MLSRAAELAVVLALVLICAVAAQPASAGAESATLSSAAKSEGGPLSSVEGRQSLVAREVRAQKADGAQQSKESSDVRELKHELEERDAYINKLEAKLRASDAQLESRLAALEDKVSTHQTSLVTALSNFSTVYEIVMDPIHEGETAWTLVCCIMVLMMTIPGLALFYGGLVRATNVLSTVMQCFSIACLITVEWLAFGYSLCFAEGSPVIGGSSRFWMRGMSMHKAHPIRPSIPEPVFAVYTLMFAIITPALISGSFADRMKFGPMLVFMGLWHIFVFCPICHSMWMTDGFLYKEGILDFAGGNVVHVAAGMAGLVSSIVVGKRAGFGEQSFPAYNILISVMGASLLWVGWLGFNGGSVEDHGTKIATIAVLNTQISTATASLTWMLTEWFYRKRPSVLGIISGAIAGMVTITPGAGYVDQTGAFVFGLLAGPVCYFAAQLKTYLAFDDALDAFGIHGPGGILGGVLTGLFATEDITGKGSGVKGSFYGNGKQIGLQLYGIVMSIVWSVILTYILLKLVDLVLGLRVPIEDELAGLDVVCHGDTVGGVMRTGSRTPSEHEGIYDGVDNSRRRSSTEMAHRGGNKHNEENGGVIHEI